MQRLVAPIARLFVTTRLALLLALVGALGGFPPLPARAAHGPGQDPGLSSTAQQPSADPPLVPGPASSYALNGSWPGSLADLSGWQELPAESSPNGSFYRGQFQTSDADPDVVGVEFRVYLAGSGDQADRQYDALQTQKRQQMRAPLQGESGWTADRVSTYQANRSSDGVAGIVLRFRNAVGLIEIRGSGQYAGRATRDSARALMTTMLQSFQRAATRADAATG